MGHHRIFRKPATYLAGFLSFAICATSLGGSGDWRLLRQEEPHMGTLFTIYVWSPSDQVSEAEKALKDAFNRVQEINRVASDYLPDSEINQLVKHPVNTPFPASADLIALFSASQRLHGESKGAFDITCGSLVRLWRQSKRTKRLPTEEARQRALARVGMDQLSIDKANSTITKTGGPMLLDLGGIGKGYAADQALQTLVDAGFTRVLVAASGDIRAGDAPPDEPRGWKVAVQTRRKDGDLPQLYLLNAALSTSGDARQFLEIDGVRFSHIVSPFTGLGLTEQIAATVYAPTSTEADSLATTVCILGQKEGLNFIENRRGVEARAATARPGSPEGVFIEKTSGFPELFLPSPLSTDAEKRKETLPSP